MKKRTKQSGRRAARTTRPTPRPKAKARSTQAKKKVAPVPTGYHTVTPQLVCRNTSGAIEFYKKAFGARELLQMKAPDGSVAHAEIKIGDSRIMLGDEMPQMGATAPQTIGGSAVHIFLYVKDVNTLFAQAVAAGATATMSPADMFWGDRYAKVTDPYGHKWSMATHIEDLSPKEMARRGAEEMAKQQS